MFASIFPGQGTLRVGMGAWMRRRPSARAIFDAADDILARPLSTTIARGPAAELIDTRNAQPAVTVCNIAALTLLEEQGIRPAVTAGHSVGEFSALYAAGVLDLEATLKLVEARASLMWAVTRVGGMGAVMGSNLDAIEKLVAEVSTEDEPLVVAVENGETHTVVSGSYVALDRFEARLESGMQLRRLDVSNGFHSPLMNEAADRWSELVGSLEFGPPKIPVVPNVVGDFVVDPATLHTSVISQLTGRVRWTETVHALARRDNTTCIEVGASNALAKVARAAGYSWISMAEPSALTRISALADERIGTS